MNQNLIFLVKWKTIARDRSFEKLDRELLLSGVTNLHLSERLVVLEIQQHRSVL